MEDVANVPDDHATAVAEHAAWRLVVAEWERLRLPDFNGEKATPLIKAIELWGEHLVALRLFGSEEDRRRWLAEAEAAFRRCR